MDTSECKSFIEASEKFADLLHDFNQNGIKDTTEFSTLATTIISATDEKGKLLKGDCDEAQTKSLVKVNSKSVIAIAIIWLL